MNSQEDNLALVQRIKRGDDSAVSELYEAYRNHVFVTAMRFLECEEDSEEVMNDVFMKLYQKIRQNKYNQKGGKFHSWLCVLSRNTILDMVRKMDMKRQQENMVNFDSLHDSPAAPTLYEPDKIVITESYLPLLEDALSKMTKPNHRIVFILKHFEGYKIKEIAHILQQKEGTVKIWLYRARLGLAEILTEKGITLEEIRP